MPMHFGYRAHLLHGVPMRPSRSGRAMQRALDAGKAWREVKALARTDEVLRRRIEALRAAGLDPDAVVTLLDRERDAQSRFEARRAEALRRAREEGA